MEWSPLATQEPAKQPGDDLPVGRLLLRFGVGLAALTGERLLSGLRAISEGRAPEAPPRASVIVPALRPRHALFGACLAAPATLSRAAARLGPAVRSVGRLARRGRRVIDRLPGRQIAGRRLDAWRARAVLTVHRLAVVGREEEIESRVLAREAVRTIVRNTSGMIADSPELKRVIQEQSQGLAASAVTSLRVRSARADSVVESAARRLFGRRRAGSPR
jgi:hypothetical protein